MRLLISAAILALSAGLIPQGAEAKEEVNLYSYRQPFLIKPILDAFTDQTGVEVNVVFAKKGLLEKLKAEGANSPADMVLTSDFGKLLDLVDADLVQGVTSPALQANIPASYRHPDGLWYGLTVRARALFVSKERVGPDEVASYEDLAAPHMRGRLCMRSGKHVYNVGLVASVIAHKGEDAAGGWLTGVRQNLARKPQGNDRAQVKAVYEGVCDVALVNTYYMGKMATNDKKPEQRQWAEAVRIVFPNQGTAAAPGRGTHVNISGAAVTKAAKNRANAISLLEFLSGDKAQQLYAEANYEYPVKAGVALSPLVDSWGAFRADAIGLAEIAGHRAAAARLADKTRFDAGPGS